MRRLRVLSVVFGLVVMLVFGAVVRGETVISLGRVVVPGGGATVVVPVYVRMGAGGPLGGEVGSGRSVQGLVLKVVYTPMEAVEGIEIRRAGVTVGMSPMFETAVRARDGVGLVVALEEGAGRIPLEVGGEGVGDVVAEVEVRLAPELAEGTVVRLALDRRVTVLSNQAGTVVVSAENGELRFEDGEIVVGRAVWRQLREEQAP